LPLIVSNYLHSTFWWALKGYFISARVTFQPSKVIVFGTNRKRICDFLSVRNSNLGPILHRFRYIPAFVLLTPPLFHPNFGGDPVARCWG